MDPQGNKRQDPNHLQAVGADAPFPQSEGAPDDSDAEAESQQGSEDRAKYDLRHAFACIRPLSSLAFSGLYTYPAMSDFIRTLQMSCPDRSHRKLVECEGYVYIK